MDRDHAYYRAAFDGHSMPFAYVDRDLLDDNVARVLERARDKPVRVASKSLRSTGMLRYVLDADPRFSGVMCFTAAEAVYLSETGFDDLLVAYPTWDPGRVDAVLTAVADGANITLMVDSTDHVEHLERLAGARGVTLAVCVDVDLSRELPGIRFGAWRSPLSGVADVVDLARRIDAAGSLILDGVMGYEAQIAGVPDRSPGRGVKGPVVRALKRRDAVRVAQRRAEVVSAIRDAGLEVRFVNGGGTGSLETTANERAVTEVTVGSGFYAPRQFDWYDAFDVAPAAGFAVEVVRRPAPDVYTCLGGGYVASGAPGPDKLPAPYLPDGARLTDTEAAGEVQTPVVYDGPVELSLGDPVFFRHAKAGELCERFASLLVVSDGTVADEMATYRGDGRCFL